MKRVKLTDAKNQLSKYVDRVRRGERIRILVRGVPAADLVPVSDPMDGDDRDKQLAHLERRGLVRRGTGGIPDSLLEPGPTVDGPPLSQLIVEEREGGR